MLFNKGKRARNEFYFYFGKQFEAMRDGKWKFKKAHDNYSFLNAHGDLLYNLEEDPGETTNLIEKYPGVAEEMKKKMNKFIKNLSTLPEPKIQTYTK